MPKEVRSTFWHLLLRRWSLPDCVCHSGSPAVTSGDVLGIGPLNDSSSDDSLSVLQGWMAECVANHACGHFTGASGEDETANPELPTRILEISTEKSGFTTVRLVESRGMHGRYAALSHSWGPPDKQPLRTTKATYGRHLGGIAASDLPKTFREAARVAQAVGLQYLWIDSLCIIQDDKDDWSSEAPRMGPLYGKAFLVIAASGATNSTEGCFVPRWPPLLSLRIPYPSTGGYGQKSHVVLQIRLPHTALSPVFSPLGNRGWVLQEWWLARRIIHYTAAGMTWSCKRVKEMGEDCFHSRSADTPQEKLSWDGVIESYTIRRLTFLSDKTIAVQGLADAMQRSLENDAYHHGMWTSDMPQQLFWVGTHTTRPKELQDIPSWSWASTDGRCLTLSHRKFPWEPLPATLAVEDGKELVVSCHSRTCSLKKWKEFNHGAASEPPLSKASAPVTIMYNLPIHYTGKMTHQIVDEDTNEVLGIAMLDDVEAAGDCIQGCISAFLMKEVREAHHAQPCVTYFSLILQAVRSGSGSETYQRLGVGFVVDEDRVQGGTERTFRIV